MRNIFTGVTLLAAAVALLHSCRKDKDLVFSNKEPMANAGWSQQIILPIDSVVLDGSTSRDPDGRITQYQWTKISGPESGAILQPHSATTVVRPLVLGVYHFELAVTDNANAIGRDTMQVTVVNSTGNNTPPVADAGDEHVVVLPANSTQLDGSQSYDADGSITAYQWMKISGPSSFTITSPYAVFTQVTSLVEGTYLFELQVTDNGGLSARDTVSVSVLTGSSYCDISGRGVIPFSFTPVGRLSQARMPAVGAANNKIVFAGGPYYIGNYYGISDVVDIYDLVTQQWKTAQLTRPRETIPTISYGNKIFFAGGNTFFDMVVDNVDIYDAAHDTWTVEGLSIARAGMATAAVGGKVFFAGGYMEGVPASKQVDIYDTATRRWSTAQLSEARSNMGAVTVGDKIYFAGGINRFNSSTIDIYDNTNGTWSKASLKVLSGPVTGVVSGDYIYWAGIDNNTGTVEVQYIGNSNNTTGTCLSYARYMSAEVVYGNHIIFSTTNDWNNDGLQLKDLFDVYNTLDGKWYLGHFNRPITAPALISVNQKLYMGGGKTGWTSCTDQVYLVTIN